jgi:hypothetical protein
MYLVAAPRLLLKMPAPPGASRLAVAGNTLTVRELMPNESRAVRGAAAAPGPRWYLAQANATAPSTAEMWDLAYQAARQHTCYVEPDIGRKWEYQNPVKLALSAAPGELCTYDPQSPDFPQGSGFAWHLGNSFSQLKEARDAVASAGGASSVRIGHMDTGIDFSHHACPENIALALQRNFVDDGRPPGDASDPYERGPFTNPGHGTGTVGLLAGKRLQNMLRPEQNGDFLGGAPLAEILPVRIATGVVLLFTSTFAEGLDYLIAPNGNDADRVEALSMSMGGTASKSWADAVNRAYEAGIVMVTAAGNNFPLTPQSIVYPARFKRVIAACGVMEDGRPYTRENVPFGAMAGNYGPASKMDTALATFTPNVPWAEINCPGVVDMDGSGTSAATPQIAAAAALWLAKHKTEMAGWQGWEIVEAARKALFDSAFKGSPNSHKFFGQGILRAADALAVAAVRGLPKTPEDSASFSFFKVLFGLGIAAPVADPDMLGVEVAQLFHLDPNVEKSMPDPDAAAKATPEFFDAVIGSPYASKTLKAALESQYKSTAVPGADLGKSKPPERPRNQEIPPSKPAARRLRTYAFDPSLSAQLDTADVNVVVVPVPWEKVDPGPVGEYVEVIDHDPSTGCFYAPVNLNEESLLASDGLAPNAANPCFHQQMVYAVTMRTIRNFELALGRKALWAPDMDPGSARDDRYVRRLRVYPHALRERNAYYNPDKKALLFGYFPARGATPAELYPGGLVFTCLSHDIVAHETTHALLDGMHRMFNFDGSSDMLAFHEAFADIVALFQHFSLPEALRFEIARTRGDLTLPNLLAEIGQEFGLAIGLHKALRSAIGQEPDPSLIETTTEPHARGAILVAAVFRAFVAIYARRTSDLIRIATEGSGILRPGAVDPDLANRLADEAATAAQHVLTMCIRALDYCPPVDMTFGDYLRAIVTADFEVVPGDSFGYRIAFVEAFRSWGLYPRDLQTLSPQSLRWRGVQFPESQRILGDLLKSAREFADKSKYLAHNKEFPPEMTPRERIFRYSREWRIRLHDELERRIQQCTADERAKLGVDLGLDFSTGREHFEVHALRVAEKIGPDNTVQCHLILQILQSRNETGPGGVLRFTGGCTLIVDEQSLEVQYSVLKNIGSRMRLEQSRAAIERSLSLRQLYFSGTPFTGAGERFAILHRSEEV